METIPMVVTVMKLPEGLEEDTLQTIDPPEREPWLKASPFKFKSVHVLGLGRETLARFHEGLASGRLRDVTQDILRAVGAEGEEFIRREQEFHFVWTTSDDEHFGAVHMLWVVPSALPNVSAGLCLAGLRPRPAAN